MFSQNTQTEPPTILIADDSPTALKVTSSVLLKRGYKVHMVTDGEQAVQETQRLQPHAVVVDLKMPKKDGYQVCMELKSDKDHYYPILLLTAREDTESMVQGLESGADDYIIKPFNEMEFIARIRVMLRLKRLNDDLLMANRQLKYLSDHDGLTSLYNRRYFISELDKLITSAASSKANLCLAIFDVDFFKKVNDTYGHLEGDKVLKTVARHLADSFTGDFIFARYGGEEFTVLCPGRSMDFMIDACQKVIDDCRKIPFKYKETEYRVTLSAGVCCTDLLHSYNSDELIQEADKMLYQAKKSGRDCLISYQ